MGLKDFIKKKASKISYSKLGSKSTKIIQEKLSDSKDSIKLDSRAIRLRYHRIRNDSFKDIESGKVRLNKPIFIVGVPHSGTSVLSSTFKTHPKIAMWTEAPEVWEPYWAEGVDSEYNRLVPVNEDYVETMDMLRITDAFYRYTKSQHRTRFMNKNPRNTVRISYMRKIFPDAKIIHIFRDPRDVVNSITRNMPEFMIEQICDRWINSINQVREQTKEIPKSDFYEIRYEEFCVRPREILTEAYRICELNTDDGIIEKLPNSLPNFNGKWKTEMNEKYHKLLKEKLGNKMLELGYSWD